MFLWKLTLVGTEQTEWTYEQKHKRRPSSNTLRMMFEIARAPSSIVCIIWINYQREKKNTRDWTQVHVPTTTLNKSAAA